MAAPTYLNSKAYEGADGATTFTSTDAGETFDTGTGADRVIIALVTTYSGGGGSDISSFVLGGVTFTAATQVTNAGWAVKHRVFYKTAFTPTGAQSWTATMADSFSKRKVKLIAYSGGDTFSMGPELDVATTALDIAVTSTADSVAGVLCDQLYGSGTLSGGTGTTIRVEKSADSYFGNALIADRTSPGTTCNVQINVSGSAKSFIGASFNLTGAAGGGGSTGTAAGAATVSALGKSDAATTPTAAAGVATVSGVGGTLTVLVSSVFKNNTGTALASLTNVTAWVYNPTTGALVVKLSTQATDGSGVLTLQDALIVTATTYRVVYRDETSGGEGMETLTAS